MTTSGEQGTDDSYTSLPEVKLAGGSLRRANASREVAEVGALTVADLVGQHTSTVCSKQSTLTYAAELLAARDCTAVVVVDGNGTLAGVLTENDILRAYHIGVPWDYGVDSWLQSDCARLPQFVAGQLTIPPNATLVEAAKHLQEQTLSDFACRHLLVMEGPESPYRVLSSLDLARAFCRTGRQNDIAKCMGGCSVAEIMKPTAALPVCTKDATLPQAFEEMLVARQNCVLVVEDAADTNTVLGIITPRDAVRAFAEHIRTGAHAEAWMHGLQGTQRRVVTADTLLCDVAELMSSNLVHHLVVLSAATSEVVGVVSSSDVARAVCLVNSASSGKGDSVSS